MSESREYMYECYIRASAAQVWQALTTPEFTSRYFHGTHIESTWKAGDPVFYRYEPGGRVAVEGEVLESQPPERLSITWHVLYDEVAKTEVPSRVTFELEALDDQTKLRIVHSHFPPGSVVYERISAGWPWIMSSLKSLLETGQPLPLAEAS